MFFRLLMIFHTTLGFISYPQKTKHCLVLLIFKKLVERQLNTSLKHLQSDNGGEFLGFKSYLQSQGISHQISCPHTPEQNGRAERKVRHLVEIGLALSAQASLPLKYWMH